MDRDLLFSLVALQQGLLEAGQILDAWKQKLDDRQIDFADFCVKQGLISADDARRLEGMIDQALAVDGGLSELLEQIEGSHVELALASLRSIGDDDLTASVAKVHLSGSAIRHTGVRPDSMQPTPQRYRLLQPLDGARGGMGMIAIARDDELGRYVAVKQIHSQYARIPKLRERFQVEARITGNLEHPGIIPVYGFGTSPEGIPYYAMRLVEGENLARSIQEFHSHDFSTEDKYQSIQFRVLIDRLIDVAHAIAYAHSRGILHRDLKPGNILLGKYGETLVIDWGLAGRNLQASRYSRTELPSSSEQYAPEDSAVLGVRSAGDTIPNVGTTKPLVDNTEIDELLSVEDREKQGEFFGTPGFAPPEQAEGRRNEIDQRSDVFALGGILYQLLTNRTPFVSAGKMRHQVIEETRRGEIAWPRSVDRTIPRELEAICLKCLKPDKTQRYDEAQDFIADLERWKADLPVEALPENWRDKTLRWLRKHPRSVATIAVAVALTVLIVGWTNWMAARLRVVQAEKQKASEQARSEQLRADAEAARADAVEAVRKRTQVQADLEQYFRSRSDFDRMVLAKPEGWLRSANQMLATLSESEIAARDPVWLSSAERQLLFAREVVPVAPADSQSAFQPAVMKINKTGDRIVAGQFKALLYVRLQLKLYDTNSRQVLQTYSFATTDSAKTIFKGSLSGSPMSAEGVLAIEFWEKRNRLFAMTTRGNLLSWNIDQHEQPPQVLSLSPQRNVIGLTSDEALEKLFVLSTDRLEMMDASEAEPKVLHVWDLEMMPLHKPIRCSKRGQIFVPNPSNAYVIDTSDPTATVGRMPVGAQRIAYSEKAGIIVCQNEKICHILDAVSMTVKGVIELSRPETQDFGVEYLGLANDGRYMSIYSRTGSEFYSELWDVSLGTRLWQKAVPDWWLRGVSFLPDNNQFAMLEGAGLSWWSVEGAKDIASLAMGSGAIFDFASSDDGKRMIVSRDGAIEIWEAADNVSGNLRLITSTRVDGVYSVAISNNGEIAIAAQYDTVRRGRVFRWQRLPEEENEWTELPRECYPLVEFPDNADDKILVSRNSCGEHAAYPSRIQWMRLPDFAMLKKWDDGGMALTVSGRGDIVDICCGKHAVYVCFRDGSMHRIAKDLSAAEATVGSFFFGKTIVALQESPSTDRLAAGSVVGELILLDSRTLERKATVAVHRGAITGIVWCGNERLLTASSDGAIRCFRVAGDVVTPEWEIRFDRPVRRFKASADAVEYLLEGARHVERVPLDVLTAPKVLGDE